MNLKKRLKDLNLLDRFLFAEAMEDPDNLTCILEIILGREIVLKHLPQVEKEQRSSSLRRFVKLDVWAWDMDDIVYDTEVQKEDTKNLPRRSRLYQGMIDTKLLEPGTIDFNELNDVFVIIIAPFDLFGYGLYRYTFQMQCLEVPGLTMEDGATRIFLNTHGTNPQGVNHELINLLMYMEHTNPQNGDTSESTRIRDLHRRIEAIKSSEEIGVKFMQEWEEKIIEKQRAREEGLAEGRAEGRAEGKAEGRAEAQAESEITMQRYIQLILMLSKDNQLEKITEAVLNPDLLESLYAKYNL